jgi:hypothetical protein
LTVLVDTSVWVDHLRVGDPELVRLLERGAVVCHPHVVGELACGNLRHRKEILRLLAALPTAPEATHDEVLAFLHHHRLPGRGLGWIDVHLLAAAMLASCRVWSRDRALHDAAKRLGFAYPG